MAIFSIAIFNYQRVPRKEQGKRMPDYAAKSDGLLWFSHIFPLELLLCFLVWWDWGQTIFPSLETLEIQNRSFFPHFLRKSSINTTKSQIWFRSRFQTWLESNPRNIGTYSKHLAIWVRLKNYGNTTKFPRCSMMFFVSSCLKLPWNVQ